MWKILKSATTALRNWVHAYDDLEIGRICPENIAFDYKGHAKIVHLFSFLPDELIMVNGQSHSYFDINPIHRLTRTKASEEQRLQNITKSLQ
jgi:hypothetical protein